MIPIKSNSFERHLKRLIPDQVKKIIIMMLINKFTGRLIKFLKIRFTIIGGKYNYNLVSDLEAAKIFFGLWESAEIRYSKKYAKSHVVIELGSSIGVTLALLSNIKKNTKFICLEASNINFKKLQKLRSKLSNRNKYILVNKAISYKADTIAFEHISTTGSSIDKTPAYSSEIISTITLNQLILDHCEKERFTLITDIEGAEADIFFMDKESLINCNEIIAELEDTEVHSQEDQINQLESLGFKLIERYGKVVVMVR